MSSNLSLRSGVQRPSLLSFPPPSPGCTLSFGLGWGREVEDGEGKSRAEGSASVDDARPLVGALLSSGV